MSRSSRSDVTRSEILDAAWTLIREQGADVSLSEIARAASVTRQSVYLHFGTRGGLLLAMVRRTDERSGIIDRFGAVLDEPDPHQRFERFIAIWLAFVREIFPVAQDLIRLRDTDPDAASAWEDRMAALKGLIGRLIGSLQKDGALQPHWQQDEATGFLWASISVQMWGLLVRDCSWSDMDAERIISGQAARALLI